MDTSAAKAALLFQLYRSARSAAPPEGREFCLYFRFGNRFHFFRGSRPPCLGKELTWITSAAQVALLSQLYRSAESAAPPKSQKFCLYFHFGNRFYFFAENPCLPRCRRIPIEG